MQMSVTGAGDITLSRITGKPFHHRSWASRTFSHVFCFSLSLPTHTSIFSISPLAKAVRSSSVRSYSRSTLEGFSAKRAKNLWSSAALDNTSKIICLLNKFLLSSDRRPEAGFQRNFTSSLTPPKPSPASPRSHFKRIYIFTQYPT